MDFSTEALLKFDAGTIDQEELFDLLFAPEALYELFETKFKKGAAKGLDRFSGVQYSRFAVDEIIISSKKCLGNEFRFTPYLERLKNKGRAKAPRVIGIPTVRDRVFLAQLNRFLAAVFPSCVTRNVASGYIREISRDLKDSVTEDTWVCGTDIRSFYDDIPRKELIQVISKRVSCARVLKLIHRAMETPVVPSIARRSSHKDYKTTSGVPQGLAISNILAAIYMEDVDSAASRLPVSYYRYVDDVLIYGEKKSVSAAYEMILEQLNGKGLKLHPMGSDKTTLVPSASEFGYLGYIFKLPLITVRESTVERFLQSIAAKFTDFKLGKNSLIKKFDYLDEARVKDIFLLELNEKITGAVSENKRYGWISYFNQINDFQLIARMDVIISRMFERLPEFGRKPPPELKRLHKSYYEMKYRPQEGYVHNYDVIESRAHKLVFLVERGRIGPKEVLSDEEISKRYDSYRLRILKEMHADEGALY